MTADCLSNVISFPALRPKNTSANSGSATGSWLCSDKTDNSASTVIKNVFLICYASFTGYNRYGFDQNTTRLMVDARHPEATRQQCPGVAQSPRANAGCVRRKSWVESRSHGRNRARRIQRHHPNPENPGRYSQGQGRRFGEGP